MGNKEGEGERGYNIEPPRQIFKNVVFEMQLKLLNSK
jgi:hypothetical protein